MIQRPLGVRGVLGRSWLLVAVLVLAAACGGDSAGDSAVGDSQPPGDRPASSDVAPTDDCPATSVVVTNHTTGDTATTTAAAARTVRDRALYDLYVASFELDADELARRGRVDVPAEEHLVHVQMTAFNVTADDELAPLAVGSEIVPVFGQDGITTFLVGHHTHEQAYGLAREDDTSGRLAITGLGGVVCAEIDYTDADKTVSGTIRAPIID